VEKARQGLSYAVLFSIAAMVAVLVFCSVSNGSSSSNPPGGSLHFYFAGYSGTSATAAVPVYWRDAALSTLPMGRGNAFGMALGILFDHSGNLYNSGWTGPSNSAISPTYWINGVFYSLPLNGTDTYGEAIGIALGSS